MIYDLCISDQLDIKYTEKILNIHINNQISLKGFLRSIQQEEDDDCNYKNMLPNISG